MLSVIRDLHRVYWGAEGKVNHRRRWKRTIKHAQRFSFATKRTHKHSIENIERERGGLETREKRQQWWGGNKQNQHGTRRGWASTYHADCVEIKHANEGPRIQNPFHFFHEFCFFVTFTRKLKNISNKIKWPSAVQWNGDKKRKGAAEYFFHLFYRFFVYFLFCCWFVVADSRRGGRSGSYPETTAVQEEGKEQTSILRNYKFNHFLPSPTLLLRSSPDWYSSRWKGNQRRKKYILKDSGKEIRRSFQWMKEGKKN